MGPERVVGGRSTRLAAFPTRVADRSPLEFHPKAFWMVGVADHRHPIAYLLLGTVLAATAKCIHLPGCGVLPNCRDTPMAPPRGCF